MADRLIRAAYGVATQRITSPDVRVVHLAEFTPRYGGSFLPFAGSVLGAAASRGWRAELVVPEAAREREWVAELAASGASIRFSPPVSRRRLVGWIEALLDEHAEPTILHTHFTSYDIAAALAARRRPQVHVYWHIHTVLSSSPRRVAANAIKLAGFGGAVAQILCPASNIADALAARGRRRLPISVFPNPIDVSAFPLLGPERRAASRLELGVPAEARCLLLFGRDWRLKGGDVFAGSLEALRREGTHEVFGLIRGDEEAAADLAERGLGGVTRITGPIDDVQTLFGAADILLAPSRGEGMPFSVLESLCSGTPVIASDLPGHRFVADNVDACVIAEREPAAFAAEADRMLSEPAAVIGERCAVARRWIGENLGLEPATDRLMAAYAETFAGNTGAR